MIDAQPARPFTWIHTSWGRALQCGSLAGVARHCFTTRDLTLRGDDAERGWAALAASVGVHAEQLIRLKQVHGVEVVVVRHGDGSPVHRLGGDGRDEGRPHADVVMTDDPDIAVAVQVADCVPLLLADPVVGAVAAVHAGWRGTAARVVQVAIDALASCFGAKPGDLIAAIGPAIGACCYQVRSDVVEVFQRAGFGRDELRRWFREEDGHGHYRLDVPGANRDHLLKADVKEENVAVCGLCTACHPLLFPSYRRDGAGSGRIAAVIRPGHLPRPAHSPKDLLHSS